MRFVMSVMSVCRSGSSSVGGVREKMFCNSCVMLGWKDVPGCIVCGDG